MFIISTEQYNAFKKAEEENKRLKAALKDTPSQEEVDALHFQLNVALPEIERLKDELKATRSCLKPLMDKIVENAELAEKAEELAAIYLAWGKKEEQKAKAVEAENAEIKKAWLAVVGWCSTEFRSLKGQLEKANHHLKGAIATREEYRGKAEKAKAEVRKLSTLTQEKLDEAYYKGKNDSPQACVHCDKEDYKAALEIARCELEKIVEPVRTYGVLITRLISESDDLCYWPIRDSIKAICDRLEEEEDVCPACFRPAEECVVFRWMKEEPQEEDGWGML